MWGEAPLRNPCIVLFVHRVGLSADNTTVVAALGGALIGGLVTFVPSYIIRYLDKKDLKNNIKNLLKLELETVKKFLSETVKGAEGIEENRNIVFKQGKQARVEIIKMMPDKYFKPVNYLSLQAETKARVFDYNTLDSLEKTFRDIRDVYCYENESKDFFFRKEKVDSVIIQIENMLGCL